MSSKKMATDQKADALSILKRWERGDTAPAGTNYKQSNVLNQQQLRRLWSLTQSPTAPGLISSPLPR